MRRLPARLFGSIVRAICWNTDFYLRAVPAAIYSWESSCVRGEITTTYFTCFHSFGNSFDS